MNFEDLKNPELQERLKSAKTPEEILAIANEAGFELTDDQLQAISGGDGWMACNDNDCQKDWAFDVL